MLFSHSANSAIGIDIGTTSIKAVQLEKYSGNKFRLVNYGMLETRGHTEHFNNAIQSSSLKPLSSDLISYLTLLKERMPIKNNMFTVASMPTFTAFTTLLDLPVASSRQVSRSLSHNLENYIPAPISTVTLDWIKVGEKAYTNGDKKQTVLVVSIPNEKIEAYENVFTASGLNFTGSELENVALARSLTRHIQAPTLIIDVGGRSTSLSVGQAGVLEFVGQTDFSSGSISQALSTGLNIALDRADQLKKRTNVEGVGGERQLSTIMRPIIDVIINEAARVRDAFEKSYNRKIEHCVLTGAGASMPGFAGYVSKKINLPLAEANPFTNILYPPELEAFIPQLKGSLALSIGLALKLLS